ncbi:hypothetical protein [Campylobacter troglodytis]|uniref:hypothetical protein n=1 Tax=Campylobacter troglodytis TaxID=654363 RepID=UPI001159FC16|nr:hypothetical protein [Campylobacter troglodytis]TQR61560.1 hypothetical protein DMC01_00900 [Campylobacter troglodytis]
MNFRFYFSVFKMEFLNYLLKFTQSVNFYQSPLPCGGGLGVGKIRLCLNFNFYLNVFVNFTAFRHCEP